MRHSVMRPKLRRRGETPRLTSVASLPGALPNKRRAKPKHHQISRREIIGGPTGSMRNRLCRDALRPAFRRLS